MNLIKISFPLILGKNFTIQISEDDVDIGLLVDSSQQSTPPACQFVNSNCRIL